MGLRNQGGLFLGKNRVEDKRNLMNAASLNATTAAISTKNNSRKRLCHASAASRVNLGARNIPYMIRGRRDAKRAGA